MFAVSTVWMVIFDRLCFGATLCQKKKKLCFFKKEQQSCCGVYRIRYIESKWHRMKLVRLWCFNRPRQSNYFNRLSRARRLHFRSGIWLKPNVMGWPVRHFILFQHTALSYLALSITWCFGKRKTNKNIKMKEEKGTYSREEVNYVICVLRRN